jgi:hypothetical protein
MARDVFNEDEMTPGARKTDGNNGRVEIDAAIAAHVLGQRVVKIEVERKVDMLASLAHGQPVEYSEIAVHLENNIYYVFRVTTFSGGIIRQGEGLGNVEAK